MSQTKKFRHIVAIIAVAMISLLSACSEKQFAAEVGSTTLGAIAMGVYETATGAPCQDGPRTVLVEGQDFWGRNETHSEVRDIKCDELPEAQHAQEVAEAYELSERASWLMMKAMKEASTGDIQPLREAGFEDADLMAVAQFKLPDRESMSRIADHFGMDPNLLTKSFKKILIDAKRLSQMRAKSRAQ